MVGASWVDVGAHLRVRPEREGPGAGDHTGSPPARGREVRRLARRGRRSPQGDEGCTGFSWVPVGAHLRVRPESRARDGGRSHRIAPAGLRRGTKYGCRGRRPRRPIRAEPQFAGRPGGRPLQGNRRCGGGRRADDIRPYKGTGGAAAEIFAKRRMKGPDRGYADRGEPEGNGEKIYGCTTTQWVV